jgi:hypothetical protein
MHVKSLLSEKCNRHRISISPEHHTSYLKTAYNKEPNLAPFNEYNIKATSNTLSIYKQLPRLQLFKIIRLLRQQFCYLLSTKPTVGSITGIYIHPNCPSIQYS